MPLSAPASLGRPRRPESFIPGPDTCGNAPWPSATPNSASPLLFLEEVDEATPKMLTRISKWQKDEAKYTLLVEWTNQQK